MQCSYNREFKLRRLDTNNVRALSLSNDSIASIPNNPIAYLLFPCYVFFLGNQPTCVLCPHFINPFFNHLIKCLIPPTNPNLLARVLNTNTDLTGSISTKTLTTSFKSMSGIRSRMAVNIGYFVLNSLLCSLTF